MNSTNITVSLVILTAVVAGSYWFMNLSSPSPMVATTAPVTVEAPKATVQAVPQAAVAPQASTTSPTINKIPTKEEMVKLQQKLNDIQKLPPQERESAMQKFRDSVMKQYGNSPSSAE